ncbi:MAG: hypothetical protein P9M13_03215 [Candidatus Ancaeobacter aquaticus]|nr:hypothetical protein [Candidatus Ancaeobacter aquaticus]
MKRKTNKVKEGEIFEEKIIENEIIDDALFNDFDVSMQHADDDELYDLLKKLDNITETYREENDNPFNYFLNMHSY